MGLTVTITPIWAAAIICILAFIAFWFMARSEAFKEEKKEWENKYHNAEDDLMVEVELTKELKKQNGQLKFLNGVQEGIMADYNKQVTELEKSLKNGNTNTKREKSSKG